MNITDIEVTLAEDGKHVCCTGYTDDDRVALWSYLPSDPFDQDDEAHVESAKESAVYVFAFRSALGVLRLQ